MILGICGGLARYFALDSTLIRVITFFTILFTAIVPGVIIYFILGLVIPLDPSEA